MRIPVSLSALVLLAASATTAHAGGYYDRYPSSHGDRYPSSHGGHGVVSGSGNVRYAYGEVLEAQPIYRTNRYPTSEQVCWEEPVEYYERGRARSPAGTLVGALIGGVVGSQIGSGGGRRAATAAGVLIGASAGHESSRGSGYVRRGYEQRCSNEQRWESSQEVVGYDVTYRYLGQVYQTQTDRHPGDSIRVRVAVDAVR